MINSGEANIEISEATLKYPTNVCLSSYSKTPKLTKTTNANITATAPNNPNILSCNEHFKEQQTVMQSCKRDFNRSAGLLGRDDNLSCSFSVRNENAQVD